MMSAEPYPYITVEEYLEGEKHSEVRHEYFDGVVYAMSGASDEHEKVSGNLFRLLGNHLLGKGCRVYKDGMKVRSAVTDRPLFYYPDIMVAYDSADDHRYYKERPKLVIEVLSQDENKDLVEKFFVYQRITSIEEYVVVKPDPTAPEVHIFRRSDGWEPGETHRGMEAQFTLQSVALTLRIGDLFVV